jgi:amino acid adenylation domain-containing protein
MINKAIDLLYLAKQSNIEIILLDGKLQLKVPKDTAIDKSLLEEIKTHKQLIIDFLQSNILSKTVNKISKTERSNLENDFPLSYSQERLWFLDKMEGSVQYHMPAVFRLKGKLNIEALSQALKMLVKRHEAVRTVFEEKDGAVFQKIISDAEWQLKVLTEINEANLSNLVQNLINTPFDLTKDYLLRATLIEVKPTEHLMVAIMHHIASDGWSRSVLVKEIIELYDAFNSGRPFELPTLELQYSDFAIWQRKALKEAVLDKKLSYWKEKLLAVPSLQLPTDFKRPSIWNSNGDTETDQINKLITNQLRAVSQDNRSTLFMTLLAVFKVLLFRHSSQTDICVGTPIAGRDQKELENLIGFFVNTLALRTEFTAEMPFTELLEKVRNTTLEAYEHQDVPFEKVVDEVVSERDISRNPLFQVMFVMLNTPEIPELSIGEVQLLREPAGKTTAKFDLQFFITETSEGLHLSVEYCTALFSRETVQRLITHFKNLLSSIVEHPNYKLCNLQMLSPDEESKLLSEFNNTKVQYPAHKTVIDLFENQVEKSPDAIAVVLETDHISFKELNQRANKLANYILKLGAQKETIIPICLERSFEMLVGIFGILKAGCAYVPIDPEYPEDRIQFMLDDSGADIILTTTLNKERVKNKKAKYIIELDSPESPVNAMSVDNPGLEIDVHNLAYVIYTSGSTGKPKGAMNEHRGLYNRLNWAQDYFKLTPNDVVLQKTTFSFDVSVWELIWPLMVGVKLVLAKPGGQKDNSYLKSVIEANKVTMLHFVPSMLGVFLPDIKAGECSSLDKVLCSGEALQLIHTETFRCKLPNATLHNLYGPTEASIDVTCWTMTQLENENVPIGKPVSNTTIYLLDGSGQLAPLGGKGEIHIGGVQVARGYLNRPELTAEKFIGNPFDNNENSNLYKTGDIGRWLNDGNLEYLGRIDDQVKIRGFRVELNEVENALGSLEEITANCALVKSNPDGVQKLVDYYVPDFKIIKEKEKLLYQAQVTNWKALYENEYGSTYEMSEINEELNLVGWNDSFSGIAIPETHMKLWIDDIVDLVLSEKNPSILEIGCGTGLIFYQLAGKVKNYFGTDLSSTAINQIKKRVAKGVRNYGNADFQVKGAHEVVFEKRESINTILLNSIVQYFPGEEYMNSVIENSLNILKDGGRIIIGDVRDLRLLDSFKSRLQLHKMQNSASIKEFNWAVEMDLIKEEELCFDPAYFLNLQELHPEIKHVELLWKQADYLNELSAYRFTVILHVGNAPQIANFDWQAWDKVATFKNVQEKIKAGEEKILLKNAPNPRLEQDSLLKAALENHSIGSVGELQKLTNQTSKEFEEIKELMQLAANNGYSYQLLLNENSFKVNLVFEKGDTRTILANDFELRTSNISSQYTNIPLFTDINALIQKEIRVKIQEVLPDYMIPTEFLPLRQLPLTINGKVDRKFLSQRDDYSFVNRLNYVAAESDLEKTLVQIWEQLLHIDRIGVNDNFFELGGHSLLVIRMISACRNQLNIELNIREVFLFPTIALLSEHIQRGKDEINHLPVLIKSVRPQLIPLSFAQERLWFIDKLEGSTQYHIPFVLRLKGDLKIDLLQQSFQQIVNRHEVLRTVIKEQNGEGFQYVKPENQWKLQEIECTKYSKLKLMRWQSV